MVLAPGLNHRTGRRAAVVGICLHVTEGSAESAVAWFRDPTSQVSAHYLVTQSGHVIQIVSEENEAWAQGRVDRPTSPLVLSRPGENPNSYLVSIEHEGDGAHELTDPQRAASIALIRAICERHQIPILRYYIVGHHEIFFPKHCPGAISVDRLVREAAAADDNARSLSVPVYSPSLGWLVPMAVASDESWTFATVRELRAACIGRRPAITMQAGTKLSEFARATP